MAACRLMGEVLPRELAKDGADTASIPRQLKMATANTDITKIKEKSAAMDMPPAHASLIHRSSIQPIGLLESQPELKASPRLWTQMLDNNRNRSSN